MVYRYIRFFPGGHSIMIIYIMYIYCMCGRRRRAENETKITRCKHAVFPAGKWRIIARLMGRCVCAGTYYLYKHLYSVVLVPFHLIIDVLYSAVKR